MDLSHSRRYPGWHSPVTVSMALHDDRSMITHGHPAPVSASELVGDPPSCRAAVVGVAQNVEPWARAAAANGNGVAADVRAFIDDMAEAYGWADLVVCRSGALTVS